MANPKFSVLYLCTGLLFVISVVTNSSIQCSLRRLTVVQKDLEENPMQGSLRKQTSHITVSMRDENNTLIFYNDDNANIRSTTRGNDIHIDIEASTMSKSNNVAKEEPNDQCPPIVRKKVGVFNEETSRSPFKDDFEDTILLVASNYAYYNLLQNWEYLANELDLKWMVLALDERLYKELGPDRAVPPDPSFAVSGAYGWREGQFQTLSCNKMRMAYEIATNCKVNVVFTDADNIFFKNPFEHDLGRLIRSKRYDYLYQTNYPVDEPREDWCMQGKPRREANTGFYYISHDNGVYKRVIESTLERCQDPNNEIDDQTLFWEEFWKVKKDVEGYYGGPSKGSFHHCGFEEYENPELVENEIKSSFDWCCLDPYYYPTGNNDVEKGPSNRDPVTYHANYAKGYRKKILKLKYARPDNYGWNESRFEDGVGWILS
mmetsp:Transcript_11369/g.27240  ORF Transcript_11369/g.27240 Transcript_11369/m.27240 type:complete len:432 (-) Transcript_11369:1052-2347(-)